MHVQSYRMSLLIGTGELGKLPGQMAEFDKSLTTLEKSEWD